MSSNGKVHFLGGHMAGPKYHPEVAFTDNPQQVTCETCIRSPLWRNAYIRHLRARKELAGE